MHYTRAMLTETRATDDGGKRYRFRASTTGVARDGFIIPADEWKLDNYRNNPVILASHDYYSLPIGRAISVEVDDEGLVAEVEYDADDPVARDVMRKLDGGFMAAVSVGFSPARAEYPRDANAPGVFREVELLEISNVAVPSDPGALKLHGLPHSPTDTELAATVARLVERIDALEARTGEAGAAATPEADPADTVATIDLSDFPTLKELLNA